MQTSTFEDLSISKVVVYIGLIVLASLLLLAIALIGKRKKQ